MVRIYRSSSMIPMTIAAAVALAAAVVAVVSSSTIVVAFTTTPSSSHYGSTKTINWNNVRSSSSSISPSAAAGRSLWTSHQSSSSSCLFSSMDTAADIPRQQQSRPTASESISKLTAMFSKIGMIAFIVSMCLTLPFALFPPWLLYKLNVITKVKQQQMALRNGQFCARWLLRLIPFCSVKCEKAHQPRDAEPSIWVCNHTSALDVFILLAKDLELRGPFKRPIKIVYWQGLEDNLITKLLFRQCGFIPVQMTANAAGDANDYDVSSFKKLLKNTKQAFQEGFDVGILPEGQLNPHPTEKLLPCFPGAYTLAKMSRRPIQLMALHGTHKLWHADEDIGMTVTGRKIQLKVYPGGGRRYTSPDEFISTFEAVVGSYATTGRDLDDDELSAWLDGTRWASIQQEQKEEEEEKQNAMKMMKLREELESTTTDEAEKTKSSASSS